MNMHRFDQSEADLNLLRENPREVDASFQEEVIRVTSFLRDPAAWKALAGAPLTGFFPQRPEHLPGRNKPTDS